MNCKCTWCGAEKASKRGRCPAQCDRPPGWRLEAPYPDGRRHGARSFVLTPLGWETAGYVRDGSGWKKAP